MNWVVTDLVPYIRLVIMIQWLTYLSAAEVLS